MRDKCGGIQGAQFMTLLRQGAKRGINFLPSLQQVRVMSVSLCGSGRDPRRARAPRVVGAWSSERIF